MRPEPPERAPDRDLPPMRVNTVTMVLVGIGVWVVAIVVALLLRAGGIPVADGVLRVCGAGVILGVLALAWAVPQHRRDLRDETQRRAGRQAATAGRGPTTPGTTTPQPAREDGHR